MDDSVSQFSAPGQPFCIRAYLFFHLFASPELTLESDCELKVF